MGVTGEKIGWTESSNVTHEFIVCYNACMFKCALHLTPSYKQTNTHTHTHIHSKDSCRHTSAHTHTHTHSHNRVHEHTLSLRGSCAHAHTMPIKSVHTHTQNRMHAHTHTLIGSCAHTHTMPIKGTHIHTELKKMSRSCSGQTTSLSLTCTPKATTTNSPIQLCKE